MSADFVNAWIEDKLAETNKKEVLKGKALEEKLKKMEGEIAELRARGVNFARLGAGMAAALTGGDIDMAAQTGGNAAANNALPLLLIIYGACEAVDAGIKIYNAYKLAEAIQDGDEEAIKRYGTEILVDTAVDAAPLGAFFTKLGMTKVGLLIAGLGAKVGDNVAALAARLGQKYGDNIWTSTASASNVDNALRHWNDHGIDFPDLKTVDEYVDYAHDFLKNPPTGTLTKTRANGEVLRYDPSTNTFGVMTSSGQPKTLFKPSAGYAYWLRQ